MSEGGGAGSRRRENTMDLAESKKRMEEGRLYLPGDPGIFREQQERLELLYRFNALPPSRLKEREALLKEMFASLGEGCYFEPPLRANWAGKFVRVGSGVYANFNLTLVDDGEIVIGDQCMFGPNVTIATAGHPVDPDLRRQTLQFNLPVRIGRNVWVGAGSIILPGVTVGDDTVIGAGSVVTKDLPAGVVAVGNPCRVLRPVGERDKEFYWRDRRVDWK